MQYDFRDILKLGIDEAMKIAETMTQEEKDAMLDAYEPTPEEEAMLLKQRQTLREKTEAMRPIMLSAGQKYIEFDDVVKMMEEEFRKE